MSILIDKSTRLIVQGITGRDGLFHAKKLFLNIRRRRWIVKDEGRYVSRNWKLVAEGSRMTHDFASFLKELY